MCLYILSIFCSYLRQEKYLQVGRVKKIKIPIRKILRILAFVSDFCRVFFKSKFKSELGSY